MCINILIRVHADGGTETGSGVTWTEDISRTAGHATEPEREAGRNDRRTQGQRINGNRMP